MSQLQIGNESALHGIHAAAGIRSVLISALYSDLIRPSRIDIFRKVEQIAQPLSLWYTTGFLVPHVFQQETGPTSVQEKYSFADLAGEEPSNDRDDMQPRLLALNAERYAEQVAQGLHGKTGKKPAGAAAAGRRRGRPPKAAQPGETGPMQAEQMGFGL